jgi:PilZ domain
VEPLSIDQRSWKRFTVAVPIRYSTVADIPVEGHAHITDLSAVGAGLQLDLPLRIGTSINLHIGGDGSFGSLSFLACVVRVTSHFSKNWRAGCTFLRELTDQELVRIV